MARKKATTTTKPSVPVITTNDRRTFKVEVGAKTVTIVHALPPDGTVTLSIRRSPEPGRYHDYGDHAELTMDTATALALSDALHEATP